ncbi:MAG TPA: serine/threonine-protein kinase [Planctomycetota bacterium]|nr:serine/threonine-protein kinase [Planctomycetota bacterium]
MVTPAPDGRLPDWEAFYRDYRKPGYVSGFEITTKLGGGMFGLVFRARKQSIGKDYAIKFLQVDDGEVRRAVLAELEQVKLFAQIDHPNLVSIEDRGEVDGIPYLVMAFAGTETLRDRIPANGNPPAPAERDELLRFFLQCCRGLAALHERSLVHFDIKPANVFLKGAVARLGDYGLSKLVTHSRGSLSMGRGTPYYMAPEMLQRRGDHRSDVYSLGVMLYELLCGRVPFTGDSEWEVLRKHETEAPVLPAHLSALERAVLQRCLQKDPAARYQSVHDLIAAFGGQERALGQARPPSRAELPHCVAPPLPPQLPPPLPPPLPRRRRGLGVVVLLCILVLPGVMLVFMSTGRSVTYTTTAAARERSRGPSRAVPSVSRPTPAPVPQTLAAKIDQHVSNVQKSARNATRNKVQPLCELDAEKLGAPPDFDSYREQVKVLARAPAFSAGHAQKLGRLGRPSFLAGISLLQDLDYEDMDECRWAANLHQFLAHVTAIEGLCVEAPAGDPTGSETCRFMVIADGWRRLAEQFAKDDADFRKMLVSKGKVAGDR